MVAPAMKADIQEKSEGRNPRPERNSKAEVRRALRQPGGAKENSPAIYRWDLAPPNRVCPAGTKEVPCSIHYNLFRPSATDGNVERVYPPINRWAIFGRPCGTMGDTAAKASRKGAFADLRSLVCTTNLYRSAGDSPLRKRQVSKRWQNYQTKPFGNHKDTEAAKIRGYYETNPSPIFALFVPVAVHFKNYETKPPLGAQFKVPGSRVQSFRKCETKPTRHWDSFFTKRIRARNSEGRIPESRKKSEVREPRRARNT
jgi:hypothetical protein